MHPLRVRAEWGSLPGKAGDSVVKNYRDRDPAYPEDVWIVDHGRVSRDICDRGAIVNARAPGKCRDP
jgi:hypothetical protein